MLWKMHYALMVNNYEYFLMRTQLWAVTKMYTLYLKEEQTINFNLHTLEKKCEYGVCMDLVKWFS